jgi:hypothetical protein
MANIEYNGQVAIVFDAGGGGVGTTFQGTNAGYYARDARVAE